MFALEAPSDRVLNIVLNAPQAEIMKLLSNLRLRDMPMICRTQFYMTDKLCYVVSTIRHVLIVLHCVGL